MSQQQVDGTLFDFGTVAETEIMKVEDELCLPYNPFTFDISLRVIKSIQPYESNISFNINSGCKSVFGRKKAQVQHVLKAPTVSSKHFVIDQHKKIFDLGSTKGTFVWVQRQKPVQFDRFKLFLVGKTQICIEKILIHEKKLILKIDGKIVQITKIDNPVLLGSHKRCHVKLDGKQYYAAIDIINMRFHNFLENEDCDPERGVWERLSGKKEQSHGRHLQPQDIIMVYPYVFKVEY